jgi:hypothetical protein
MPKTIYRFFVRTHPHRDVGLGLGAASFAIVRVLIARFSDAAGSCLGRTLVFYRRAAVCSCSPRDYPFRGPSSKSRCAGEVFVRTPRARDFLIAASFRSRTIAASNRRPRANGRFASRRVHRIANFVVSRMMFLEEVPIVKVS